MAMRTTLDSMIRRDDFAVEAGAEELNEFEFDLLPGFPITSLAKDSGVLKLLRKPDFQRETRVRTHYSHQMTAAARAIAAMKFLMLRSKRVAIRRQSLRRQNMRSMMLRCL